MFRTLTIAFLFIAFPLFIGTAKAVMHSHTLESPNGDFKVVVYIGPINDAMFGVFYKGEMIVEAGILALAVAEDDQLPATASFTLRNLRDGADGPVPMPSRFAPSSTGTSQVKSVRNVEGQADYNEMSVRYSKRKEGAPRSTRFIPEDHDDLVTIVFRAYDGGIAYRYEIATKEGETINITNELTNFIFPDDYPCEVSEPRRRVGLLRRQVGGVREATLSTIGQGRGAPLRIEIPNGLTFDIGNTPDVNFPRMNFMPGRQLTGTFSNLFDRHGNIDRTGTRTAIVPRFESDIVIRGTGRNPESD